MKRILTSLLFIATAFSTSGQVVIIPMPHQEGYFSIDDIWRVTLISAKAQPINAELEVRVEDAQHQLILSAISPSINLLQGSNRPVLNISGSRLQYGNAAATTTLRSTGRFPYGHYIICYRVLGTNSNVLHGEFCQEETVLPFTPPELVSPYQQETINTTIPILTWKPPFPPGGVPIEYAIKLVAVKQGEDAIEALEKSAPILSRSRIFNTYLPFPPEAPQLEMGKSYAWQVSAKAGEFELGVTEVWVFKVASAADMVPPTGAWKSFRELKLAPDGSYSPIKQKLKFTLNNRWSAPFLAYEGAAPPTTLLDRIYYKIYPAGKQASPVGTIAAIGLLPGTNRLTINLLGVTGMNNGENYIMVLKEPTGATYYLEFTYYN